MAKKKADDGGAPDDGVYVCEWCGREYTTKRGLSAHTKVCEYKPDSGGGVDFGGGGIDLFSDDDAPGGAPAAAGDTYGCPNCDYEAAAPFGVCPVCGAVVSWN